MSAPYTVCNLGTYAAKNVESLNKSVQSVTDMPNGSFVAITGLVTGQNDTYLVAAPTAVTTQEVLLVKTPEVVEINGLRVDLIDITNFYNPAGRPARAIHVKVGDDITITADGFTGSVVVGQYAVPANGVTTLAAAATLAGATLLAFQVLSATTIAIGQTRKTAYRLLCVKSN
jgi:hypothetical protein